MIFNLTFIIATLALGHVSCSSNEHAEKYGWSPFEKLNSTKAFNGVVASALVKQPVYVSLTTFRSRLNDTYETIQSIIHGSVKPDRIYLFVSKEPYLLDKGISKTLLKKRGFEKLTETYPVTVVFTNNIGPHRKLLPLLAHKWNEDCVIVTIDDHVQYPPDMLSSILDYYVASGRESIVALRARRIGLCADGSCWSVAPYPRKGNWPIATVGRHEMLMLPTGAGGVLYRPKFFSEYIFDNNLRNLTASGDDLMFRLATLSKGIPVVTACNVGVSSIDGDKKITCPYPVVVDPPSSLTSLLAASEMVSAMSSRSLRTHTHNHHKEVNKGEEDRGGLWSRINKRSGSNDVMWRNALEYLKNTGKYNFETDLQKYATVERSNCKLLSKLKKNNNSNNSLLSKIFAFAESSIQYIYDHECGVQYCF